jgi:hypothetical protein
MGGAPIQNSDSENLAYPPTLEVDMKINTKDRKSLYLRIHYAHGETEEGEEFDIDFNINNSCLIFTFPEAIYTVSTKDILEDVLEFRRDQKE